MKTEIAVAAGLLTLALAAPAAASPAEYSRGYNDCLYGRYDQESHSHAYRQGCRAAEHEHGQGSAGECPPDVSEADRYRYPGCEGGYDSHRHRRPPVVAPAGVPNVKGMDPGQVLSAMAARGYRNVGTEIAGAAIYGFYFNPVTGECVQVANMHGRAVGAVPVGSNPRCR